MSLKNCNLKTDQGRDMKKTILLALTASLLLVGCTNTQDPSPVNTDNPKPDVTSTHPVGPPDEKVTFDYTALDALASPDGLDLSSSLPNIKGFVENQVANPTFLSGSWTETGSTGIAESFSPYVSDELSAEIGALDVNNPENLYTLYALAAFFHPTETIKAPESCTPDSNDLSDCLSSNVVVSEVTAVPSQVSPTVAQVNFNVSTDRKVIENDEPKTASIKYSNTLWVDTATGKIVSISNKFDLGPATP